MSPANPPVDRYLNSTSRIVPVVQSLFCSLCLLATTTLAAPPSSVTQAETEHLLAFVAKSGCKFNRNGSWYSGKEAAAHLQRKYNYLAERGAVTSTEAFIDLGASRSSISGKPYWVRCASAEPVPSAEWLTSELTKYRKMRGK
ncbi:hypothetical protein AWV80_22830 [Cupriavidus sp. UYMU48A]|nr:hypothetical protein AWV80_22830 [Cupriavidus sp. UYMU48A]